MPPPKRWRTRIMTDLSAYDYHLPRELIAQEPLSKRSDARLLVVNRAARTLTHQHVRDLPELLRPGDCLVVNDTRVVPARLVGYRTQSRGRWTGLFLGADEHGVMRLLAQTRGKPSPGETITLRDREGRQAAMLRLVARLEDGMWAARPEPAEDPMALLERVGHVPLPGYIRGGQMLPQDEQQYQTVYAEKPGAVAAPTAGLHFTVPLLQELKTIGVKLCRVTLHVGLGTFRPITAATLDEHTMHAEWGCLDGATCEVLRACRAGGGRIVAVGTTVVRVLETAAAEGELVPWSGPTNLFIRPGHQFRAVDALMTNFHLPRTTLLVLVRTFGGDALIRRAYDEAIESGYRFYSYGDAMVIE